MYNRTEIKEVLAGGQLDKELTVCGWVRAFRSNRFIALFDGSDFNTIQVVVPDDFGNEDLLKKIHFHSCIKATGKLVESQGTGQKYESVSYTHLTLPTKRIV